MDADIGGVAMGVLATLLLMSVLSIAITIDRAWALRQAVARSRRCAGDLQPLIRKRDWGAAREAASFATEMSLAEMRRGLPVLATIGSTAPFVGLFGTTFGIIHAFEAMSLTGSAAMGAISAGIAEALVTTAFGLFVAIPAVWAYNAFLGRLDALRVELERGRFFLLEQLARPR